MTTAASVAKFLVANVTNVLTRPKLHRDRAETAIVRAPAGQQWECSPGSGEPHSASELTSKLGEWPEAGANRLTPITREPPSVAFVL